MYESFEVTQHDPPKLKFKFSEAAATLEDPVVISAVGRALGASDREYRVDLQKVWLRRNVPRSLVYQIRWQVLDCGKKLRGEMAACDAYVFKDPSTGKSFIYHIFIGNWP